MKLTTSGSAKVAFGIIADIGGIALAILSLTQNVHATLTTPSACACSTTIPVANNATLLNCQCGAVQCVVAVGGRGDSQQNGISNPVIACLK